MRVSPSVVLAAHFAQFEAALGEWEFVEPDHLFLGAFKLVSLWQQGEPIVEQLPAEVQQGTHEELQNMAGCLQKTGTPVDPVRRFLRQIKGLGEFRRHEREIVVHRSQASHRLFRHAEELAEKARAEATFLGHFLLALLDEEMAPGEQDRQRLAALRKFKVDLRSLRDSLNQSPSTPGEGLDSPWHDEPEGPDSVPEVDEPVRPNADTPRRPDRSISTPDGGPNRAVPRGPGRPHHRPEKPAVPSPEPAEGSHAKPKTVLDRFGRDLTFLAAEGRIRPPIGRKREMREVVRTLARATKNNPLLVGDAGVGKTAIVEGLACRIAEDRAPGVVRGKRIWQLDMAALLAGTKYRGDLEQRLDKLVRGLRDTRDVIVFIDEIHTVVGAGNAGGAMDVANMLKPILTGEGIRIIGATTHGEYVKHIQNDPALDRRFERIDVAEPTRKETLAILQGIRERLQEHHAVMIFDEALETAVDLSVKYLPDRRLPDKAIDLLDKACVSVTVQWTSAIPGEEPPEESGQTGGVTGEDVARVITDQTGIPVGRLEMDEQRRLREMAAALKGRVIGQDQACDTVTRALQRARLELKDEGRPVGVFMFAGPTGVGKTELAKASSEFLGKELLRVDMSEYMEKHSGARLIGAPPGYIGHDEEGQLTGPLRRHPHCLVLLDEMEKAHADVQHLFLQLFDSGRLTDSHGRVADGRHAVFVMTSNLGGEEALTSGDPAAYREAFKQAIYSHFTPEFINRIDNIVYFAPLDEQSLVSILEKQLARIQARFREKGVEVDVVRSLKHELVQHVAQQNLGARPVHRILEDQIVAPLTDKLLSGELTAGMQVTIGEDSDMGLAARHAMPAPLMTLPARDEEKACSASSREDASSPAEQLPQLPDLERPYQDAFDRCFMALAARLREEGITLEITEAAKRYLASPANLESRGGRTVETAFADLLEKRLIDRLQTHEFDAGDRVRVIVLDDNAIEIERTRAC